MAGFVHVERLFTGAEHVGSFNVAIAPMLRGKGLGRAAARCAESYLAQQFGITKIRLGVHCDNEIALRLYASLGYQRCAAIEHDNERPALLLGKTLEASNNGLHVSSPAICAPVNPNLRSRLS